MTYKHYYNSLAVVLSLFLSANAVADVDSNWFRQTAISPDGQSILFTAKGDIYQVPVAGGDAIPIVTDAAWDGHPVWSNDGKSIAFTSDRNGSLDVYYMDMASQIPVRLTHHSGDDYPSDFSNDDKTVIFSSGRSPSAQSSGFPTSRVHQLYSISIEGGTPTQVLTTAAMNARFSPSGKQLAYMDNKSYEDNLRKHDVSSFARDIWVYNTQSKEHTKLTTFVGGDANPVFSGEGDTLYFLSEQNTNNFNVWRMSEKGTQLTQVSNFDTHPVRDLSISTSGVLAYSWHGNIYTQNDGEPARKLDITLRAPKVNVAQMTQNIAGKAELFSVSPSGKEVAFIARGELFVSSVEFGTTVRLTDTPEQERSISWFPDSRSIAFAAEREGVWGIYKVSIADEAEPYFFAATKFSEQTLLKSEVDMFQPLVSPDGNQLAYLYQRDEIRVLDIDNNTSKTIFGAKYNYSYSDGDIGFDWSPDSKWLVATYIPRGFLFMSDLGIAPADGSKAPIDVTMSGYGDGAPQWDTNEMIVFASDRFGERAHGSWGGESDLMALFLTQEAYDLYMMSKEERVLYEEAKAKAEGEKDKGDDKDEENTDGNTHDNTKDDPKSEPVKIDWAGLDERTVRLTKHSSDLAGYALTPDMEKLYYLAKFEKGYDLWVEDFKEKSTTLALKLNAKQASLALNEKGDVAVLLNDGALTKLTLGEAVKSQAIAVNHSVAVKQDAERVYMFKHMWRQTKDKFYNANMHGIDWDMMYEQYLPKVNGVKNNRDFGVLGSELLGELNASHTGARYRNDAPPSAQTASLGVLFAPNPEKNGVKIEAILPFGPLVGHGDVVKVGTVLSAIDGKPVNAAHNLAQQLNGKAGQRVRLTLLNGSKSTDIVVRPQSMNDEFDGLYKRWVDSRRDYVDKLSNGKLAYLHVPQMNDAAYRVVHKELFGRGFDKDAVVVDTRFNRGGWLTDDLVTLLSGNQYSWLAARGNQFKGNSMRRWTKPSVLVVNEGNYSDGYCFPNGYRANNIGKIVGMPVPGTCTAVWWEMLQTGDLVFGIPQLGVLNKDGTFMENDQLAPDIMVENTKEDVATGEDAQLKRAVELLLNP